MRFRENPELAEIPARREAPRRHPDHQQAPIRFKTLAESLKKNRPGVHRPALGNNTLVFPAAVYRF